VFAFARDDDIEIEFAQSLAPPRSQLRKDIGLYYRWKLEMKRKGQACTTKVWGGRDGYTQAMALQHVLEVAWRWNEDDGFGKCPFGLEIE